MPENLPPVDEDVNDDTRSSQVLLAHGGFHTLKDKPGEQYPTMSMADLEHRMANPSAKPKREADLFLASTYVEHDGRNHAAQRRHGNYVMLPIDIDSGSPEAHVVEDAIEARVGPVQTYLYSSASATPQNKKWRGILWLSSYLSGIEYSAYATALYDILEEEGLVIDRTLARTAQPIFAPNVPAEGRDHNNKPLYYKFSILDGDLLDPRVGELHERAQSILAEAEAKMTVIREGVPRADKSTPIGWVNATYPIEVLLEQYGYTQKTDLYGVPTNDWKSPFSSGFSTRVYDDHWISLSYSDAERGIGRAKGTTGTEDKIDKHKYRFGGAFDLLVYFQFGNDVEAATAAVKSLMAEEQAEVAAKVGKGIARLAERTQTPLPAATSRGTVPDDDEGEMDFLTNSDGNPIPVLTNVVEILTKHPDWKGVFAFDVFSYRPMMMKKMPGLRGNPNKFSPRPVKDADTTHVVMWIQRMYFPRITKNIVQEAIDAAVAQNELHPVRDYLMSLPKVEGSNLLDSWLLDVFAPPAETKESQTYLRAVGRAWMISAVARVMRPGCKADSVLVINGAQGIGKSRCLRALCGDDWFSDNLPPMHTKDASAHVVGKWVIELAELANLRRSEVEHVKAFMSRSEEKFRPAYGRNEVEFPRQCVFAGTTNEAQYLKDPTGNRRFWPVTATKASVATIKAIRDTLWAEALAAYNAGEAWHLSAEVEVIREAEQQSYIEVDEWTGAVAAYLDGKTETSISEVALRSDLKLEVSRLTKVEQSRIRTCLLQLGFTTAGKQISHGPWKGRVAFSRPKSLSSRGIGATIIPFETDKET